MNLSHLNAGEKQRRRAGVNGQPRRDTPCRPARADLPAWNLRRAEALPLRAAESAANSRAQPMFAIIAVILLVMWLLGFFALHISSFLIHILLLVALISIVMHFVRGRSA
jgi:hypothetical protein